MTGAAPDDDLDRLVVIAMSCGARTTESARELLLDVLAVIAEGATDWRGGADAFGQGGDGPCSVVGLADGYSPAVAAYLNGGPTFVHQFQDGHRRARGHPGVHVVPAALATAEATGANGRDLLDAVGVGYEVAARLALAVNPMRPGVHDTGGWGAVGAAVASAHLLGGGDPQLTRTAAELAASVVLANDASAPGTGSGATHLFVAVGAQLGVLAAYAAKDGARAEPGASGRHLAHVLAGSGAADWSAALADPDVPMLDDNYLKFDNACAHVLAVLDAGRAALANTDDPDWVATRVEVEVYHQALGYADPSPANEAGVGFSIPFALATLLRRGDFGVDAATWAMRRHDDVHELAARITVTEDPALTARYPDERPARVRITAAHGGPVTGEVGAPHGDRLAGDRSDAARQKARTLLASAYDEPGVDDVIAAVDGLGGKGAGLSSLSAAIRSPLPSLVRRASR